MASYPYRWGLLIKKITIPSIDFVSLERCIKNNEKMVQKKNLNELFFRHKYPSLIFGPILFAGQIVQSSKEAGIIQIRIGVFFAALFLYLIIKPFFSVGVFGFLNSIILFAIVYLFYSYFINLAKSIARAYKKDAGSHLI